MRTIKFMAMMLLGILLSINNLWAATFVIANTDFQSSYANSDGSHTKGGITFTSSNVADIASKIQFKQNAGYLYNTTPMPGNITSITLGDGATSYCLIYAGTTQNPSASTDRVNNSGDAITGEKKYFRIACNNAGTGTTTTITITYDGADIPQDLCNITPNDAFWGTTYNGSISSLSANALTLNGTQCGIKLQLKNNSSTNGYVNGSQTRVYNGYTLKITAPSGYNLTKVLFTADGSNWAGTHTVDNGTMTNNKQWDGEASEITITFKGTCQITNIRVTLESSGPKAPVITAQPAGATYGQGDAATAMSITATDATSYQWYSNTTNSNENGTIISGATTTSYTPSTAATGTTYYYCVATNSAGSTASNTATIVVNAPATKHTVTWSVNGNTSWKTEVAEGADIAFTAPTSNIPAGYVFKGWYGSNYGPSDDAPTFVTSATMGNTDKIYYAVFAIEKGVAPSLTKLGSTYSPAAGDNIVVVATGSEWAKLMYQETVSTSYVSFRDFDGEISTISSDVKNYFTLSAGSTTGTWKLGDATNGYIHNASSNNLTCETEHSTDWTIAWKSTESKFSIKSGNRWLSCRSDLTGDNQYKWRGGGTSTTSGTVYFDLYLIAGSATYSDYRTSVGPAFTVSAVANDGALGSVNVSGNVITATPNECVGYAASAYTVTSGTASVAQDGNTFTVTPSENCEVTINFAATTEDTYLDNVQDWESSAKYCGSYSAPSITDKAQATSGTCEEIHYHFIGWTTAEYRNSPADHITAAGAAMTASGTTYYAVWAKEAE